MKIGKRNLNDLLRALFDRRHYIAFLNMLIVYPDFFDCFPRYFIGAGKYPYKIKIRTPTGMISPEIFSYFDLLTVNEIFCRKDYKAGNNAKIIVDIGSNVGISALYFLTRNHFSKCYLFEPVPANIKKLKDNLRDFENRYFLKEAAVSNESGMKKFGVEETGRYGGLSRETGKYIQVECVDINSVIERVLSQVVEVDVLKIDIEGDEIKVVQSINEKYLKKIKMIIFEIDCEIKNKSDFSIFPNYYDIKKYGSAIRLISKN